MYIYIIYNIRTVVCLAGFCCKIYFCLSHIFSLRNAYIESFKFKSGYTRTHYIAIFFFFFTYETIHVKGGAQDV